MALRALALTLTDGPACSRWVSYIEYGLGEELNHQQPSAQQCRVSSLFWLSRILIRWYDSFSATEHDYVIENNRIREVHTTFKWILELLSSARVRHYDPSIALLIIFTDSRRWAIAQARMNAKSSFYTPVFSNVPFSLYGPSLDSMIVSLGKAHLLRTQHSIAVVTVDYLFRPNILRRC